MLFSLALISTFEPFSDHLIRCRGGAIAGALSQHIGRRLTIMWVSLHANEPQIDLT